MAGTPRREGQPLEGKIIGHITPRKSDLVVIIGEERIPVHSAFLAAGSPVFAASSFYRRLLEAAETREAGTSSQSEFQVEIANVRAEVFKDLLKFVTYGVLPESGRLTTELLALAHKVNTAVW